MEIKDYKSCLNQKKSSVNLGIEVLRMILCFWVILFHYSGKYIKRKYKIISEYYHVPTFILISFYLNYKILTIKNLIKIKERIERLIIPYIIIPIIYLLIKFTFYNFQISIKNLLVKLIFQYIYGKKIDSHLWFINALLIYTIFFIIISFFSKNNNIFILQIIAIISYWSQYNLNIYNFIIYKRFVKYLPFAVTGLNFGSFEILKKLIKNRIKWIFFCFIVFNFIYNYKVFENIRGFGIKYNIVSICIFISFSLIPIEKIKNITAIIILRNFTRYTGGIYYFQKTIFIILHKIKFLKNQHFIKCMTIYILGYFICMIGTKIFKNHKIKYLFN